MNYWLMKSEPDVFGIEHLRKKPKQIEHWDGVRNYQARNMLRDQMKEGDQAFFYHSNCDVPGIVGVIEIVKAGYPDDTAFDPSSKYFDSKGDAENPRWYMVDVKFIQKFPSIISLSELRQNPKLKNMLLLRKGNRLSIMPVTEQEWWAILKMSK